MAKRLKRSDIVKLLLQGCLQHDHDSGNGPHEFWLRYQFPYHMDAELVDYDRANCIETIRCTACGRETEMPFGSSGEADIDEDPEEYVAEYTRYVAMAHGITDLDDIKM